MRGVRRNNIVLNYIPYTERSSGRVHDLRVGEGT